MRRVEIDTYEFTDSFASHSPHYPLVCLITLVNFINVHNARCPRSIIFKVSIRKWVSTPENLTVWTDRGDVSPITLNVKNNPGIGVFVCMGKRDRRRRIINRAYALHKMATTGCVTGPPKIL